MGIQTNIETNILSKKIPPNKTMFAVIGKQTTQQVHKQTHTNKHIKDQHIKNNSNS